MIHADAMTAKAARFDIVRIGEEKQKFANDSRGCVEIVASARLAIMTRPPLSGTQRCSRWATAVVTPWNRGRPARRSPFLRLRGEGSEGRRDTHGSQKAKS